MIVVRVVVVRRQHEVKQARAHELAQGDAQHGSAWSHRRANTVHGVAKALLVVLVHPDLAKLLALEGRHIQGQTK